MIDKKNQSKGEMDLEELSQKARKLSMDVAQKVLFKKTDFLLSPLQHSPQTVILSPKLLSSKIHDAYHTVFSAEPNLICWEGISPDDNQIDLIIKEASSANSIVVCTYNGDVSPLQQLLVSKLQNANLRICETNFPHAEMAWVPDGVDALCTYSADTTSLEVAFMEFANINPS